MEESLPIRVNKVLVTNSKCELASTMIRAEPNHVASVDAAFVGFMYQTVCTV